MSQLDNFIVRSHRKIIDYYRWLCDTAGSETERARFQRRLQEESEMLDRYLKRQAQGASLKWISQTPLG